MQLSPVISTERTCDGYLGNAWAPSSSSSSWSSSCQLIATRLIATTHLNQDVLLPSKLCDLFVLDVCVTRCPLTFQAKRFVCSRCLNHKMSPCIPSYVLCLFSMLVNR
mmetsp:Transcript_14743/g.25862  ORF Transcript_14743/g.25862 Transcript_14743/m.25862 type:complete len:108 (+) Transcript_14743:1464-1787(+)